MKKCIIFIIAVFLVLPFIVSCKGAPPPSLPVAPEAETPPPLPPPPPPPPAVDTSAPVLTVRLSPQPFSPDGDGVDDVLTVSINVNTKSDIQSWHIEIREPAPGSQLFSEWSGQGAPPETLTWDGLNAAGELVQSATDYQFSLNVTNIHNNTANFQGTTAVDVLVRREPGDVLRVIVPSIVFGSNVGDFSGLNAETRSANDRILRRIAEVLQRYESYQIKVEGHANPTTAPGTSARNDEERGTNSVIGLQPLSEERARTVLNYLVTLGVEQARLTAVGVGGTRPVATFADRANWWKNRRVEFILVK